MSQCSKCHGTGWVPIATHGTPKSKICDACCPHDKGWGQLTENYADPGKWCCLRGCGTVRDENPDDQ